MTSRNRGARALVLIPVVGLVVALAACSTGTGSGGSSTTPSPTPTAAAVTTPTFVFGNDCSSVVSASELATVLGTEVAPTSSIPWLDESDWAVPSLGGVRCDWQAASSAHAQSLDLIVLPASAASSSSYQAFDCTSNATSSIGDCDFNAVYSGYWFSGMLQLDTGSTNAQAQAAAVQLEAALKQSASSAPKAPGVAAITGAWTKPASCAAVDQAGDVSSSLGSPAVILQGSGSTIEDGNPDAYTAAVSTSAYLACAWESADSSRGFAVYLYPGGAWARADLVSSASTTAQVAGATSAYLSPGIEGSSLLDVFVGNNAFVVEQSSLTITTAQLDTVAAAIIKAMN